MLRSAAIALVALGFLSIPAASQEAAPESFDHRGMSLLFEATVGARLNRQPNPGVNDARWYVAWDLGPMVNRGNWALGGTFLLGADEDGARFEIRPRYRRWLGRKTAIDVGAGVLLRGSSNAQAVQNYPGFTGLVALQYGSWLGVSVEVQAVGSELVDRYCDAVLGDRVVTRGSRTDWAWIVGARASGVGALVLGLAELVLGAIAVGTADFGM